MSSKRENRYLQTKYKTAKISAIGSWKTFMYLCREKVSSVSFFKIHQKNKSLRKSYEDYFIYKFTPLLNKKTEVAKPPKVAGS